MGSADLDASRKAFNQKLQDLIIQQTSRIINNDLYTKSLLSSLPVALISTDKNGLIQVANRAAEEMLQARLQSIKGSSLMDMFSLFPAIAENIKQARDQKAPVSTDSLDLILADGQQKVVNIHVQPFNDEERNTVGTLPTLLFQDHELKQLRTTRLILVLLLLGWGPFAAFQIAHLPGFDTLFILTDQHSMLYAVLPEHGISLLALVQLGVIWFGALMAVVTLLGMGWRVQHEKASIAGRNWYLIFGVCLFYPLLNSWIVL